jgi:hypothetical protein
LIAVIVGELCQGQTLVPTLIELQDACSQDIFQNLIYSFRLTIGLRMITGTTDQLGSQTLMQLFPKTSHKLSPSIRDYSLWDSMQMNYVIHVQLCILLYGVSGVHGNEVNGLGEFVYDYPNRVFLSSC